MLPAAILLPRGNQEGQARDQDDHSPPEIRIELVECGAFLGTEDVVDASRSYDDTQYRQHQSDEKPNRKHLLLRHSPGSGLGSLPEIDVQQYENCGGDDRHGLGFSVKGNVLLCFYRCQAPHQSYHFFSGSGFGEATDGDGGDKADQPGPPGAPEVGSHVTGVVGQGEQARRDPTEFDRQKHADGGNHARE